MNPNNVIRGYGQCKLNPKKLSGDELKRYREYGEIDFSQNWLELFTPSVVSKLFEIMDSGSNNVEKAHQYDEYLGEFGFLTVGLGTNIYTMANPAYPGVVFKIAVDTNGLADNANDVILCKAVNQYLMDNGERPRYTQVLAKHPTNIVSVQERKIVISQRVRMQPFAADILRVLRIIASEYMIIDLTPLDYPLNYGIDRDGEWCFVDASDLFPIKKLKKPLRCVKEIGYNEEKHKVKICGGKLRYLKDFSRIVCKECGMEYFPAELRPIVKREDEMSFKTFSDGTSEVEREELNALEMEEVLRNMGLRTTSNTPMKSYKSDRTPVDAGSVDSVKTRAAYSNRIVPGARSKQAGTNRNINDIRSTKADSSDMIELADDEPEMKETTPQRSFDMDAFVRLRRKDTPPKPKPVEVEEADDEEDGLSQTAVPDSDDDVSDDYLLSDEHGDEEESDDSAESKPYTKYYVDSYIGDESDDESDEEDEEDGEAEEEDDDEEGSVEPEAAPPEPASMTIMESNRLQYSVVNAGTNSDALPGIYIDVVGNARKAYVKYGLPIYVRTQNGTVKLALSSKPLEMYITQASQEEDDE